MIIDRFEGDYAICEKEDMTFVDILRGELPKEVMEGDCIIELNGVYKIDKERTKQRKKKIDNMFWSLYEE